MGVQRPACILAPVSCGLIRVASGPGVYPSQSARRPLCVATTRQRAGCGSTSRAARSPSAQTCSLPSIPARRWDVVVEPEEVGRVVTTLDRPQPLPCRPWVGRADPRLALVAEEADVRPGVILAQRRREGRDP